MEGSIYKRDGVWYVQYRLNGRRTQQSLHTRNKRVAERLWAEIQHSRDLGLLGLGRRLKSSADGLAAFEREILDKKSPPWRKRMEQLFRPFKTWVLSQEDVLVTKLSASDIESFLAVRRQQISDKTLNEELAIIRRFFRWACDREYLVRDPSARIERVKQIEKVTRVFTAKELDLIWKYATPTQLPYYRMLLYTGLRDGELRNLEWDDVNLARAQIQVRIKQDWKPKTGRGRIVPICGEAHELLSSLNRTTPFVFSTRNGKRWVPPRQPWVDLLEKIRKYEGVDLRGQVSIHTFRHTFATTLLSQGVDIKMVSEFLGHTTVKMTERYLHLLPDHKIAAMRKVVFSLPADGDGVS